MSPQWDSHRLFQGSVSLELSLPFQFLPLFWLNEITILSKARKTDNFESHNSLEVSFTNMRGLYLNFVECESFSESNFPDILALDETNLNWLWHTYAMVMVMVIMVMLLNCSLFELGASFCTGRISKKLCGFLLTFLTRFTSFSILLLFPLSIFLFVFVNGFSWYFI